MLCAKKSMSQRPTLLEISLFFVLKNIGKQKCMYNYLQLYNSQTKQLAVKSPPKYKEKVLNFVLFFFVVAKCHLFDC